MNEKDFNLICNKLKERIETCRSQFSEITPFTNLEDLSLKKIKEVISFSQKEYIDQSHILMVDLYHILGMGNLSVTQNSTLIKLIKEYSSYRPILNKLGKKEIDLNNLPDIKNYEKTYFILTRFNELRLGSEEGIELDEFSNTTYSNENKQTTITNSLPYTYFNKKTGEIRYNKTEVKKLASFLVQKTALFSGFKQTSLESKLLETGSYGFYNFFVGETEGIGYLSCKDDTTSIDCLLKKMSIPEKLK